jgi:hypothetical protein
MDTTPEEETNPLVIAFKKITTQLELLDERERRAEARERHAQEREQALIERQSKLNQAMNNIVIKSENFHRSIVDVETRTKTYLADYFKALPSEAVIVTEKRWSVDVSVKQLVLLCVFMMLFSGLFVYFASPHVDTIRLDYQAEKIEELEAKLDYMVEKNPKTAKNYEAENEK